MPTPYGSRGGMAFGAEELRVLRRALALALHPSPASAEDVQDCLRLAESVDEATREGARMRAFLLADLARYRAALPGTAAGYLTLLEEALGAGHRTTPDDLAALRVLRGHPVAAALLARCQTRAEQDACTGLASRAVPAARARGDRRRHGPRLTALPGDLDTATATAATEGPGKKPTEKPTGKPKEKPAEKPAPQPRPPSPRPDRPIPTPGEVFPPRRKPAAPPGPPQQLAAGWTGSRSTPTTEPLRRPWLLWTAWTMSPHWCPRS